MGGVSGTTMTTRSASLKHHLCQYAQRNNSDFFIHKDLSGFLNRELDFYLKNEVLNLDNLVTAGPGHLTEGWFQQMRLTIKAVGGKIIDFLAQIEGLPEIALGEAQSLLPKRNTVSLWANIPAEVFYP